MGILSVSSVSFSYGETEVLRNVCFDVGASETVAIMGPSGSGKSTLFRIIAGLQKPNSGRCEVNGCATDDIRRRVFLGFQDYDAFPWHTVAKNIALAGAGTAHFGITNRSVNDILATVGLSDSSNKFPCELSGGMRKRLALARCLAANARLIILDEPFSSLDSCSRRDLQVVTRDLVATTGCGLLISTHDPYEAAFIADRVIICTGRPLTVRSNVVIRRAVHASINENISLAEQSAHEISRRINESFHKIDSL